MPQPLTIVFAYHYPPENAIGAARPFRFCKYLPRLGHDCYVFTAADVRNSPELNAEYVPDRFITNPKEGFGYDVERLVRKLLLPGVTGTQWAVHAYQAALRFLERTPHDKVTILSTYPPLGTHLAGYFLAKRKGFPWIADLRDPVADNPGIPLLNSLSQSLYRRLEKIFIGAADSVIANTDAAAEKLKESYPNRASRVELIWNGFDPEERLCPLPLPAGGPRILAHVGELYGGRDMSPLLRSVRRLLDAGKLSDADFQFLHVGVVTPSSMPDDAFVARAECEGWLNVKAERISQAGAHQVIQKAHGLLLIQPQSALQVPGKLYEYLQIGRPILAYVPRHSPVERILERSGIPYVCAYAPSTDAEMDEAILRFLNCRKYDTRPNEWFENEFNAELHARKVAGIVDRLLK